MVPVVDTARRTRKIRGLDAEQRRERRRRAILDAAIELFATDGYANTSIEQLCQAAFVSTKSFYEVFDGRESVYKTLFVQLGDAIREEMAGKLEALGEDEETATRELLEGFLYAVLRDPRGAHVLYGAWRAITPDIERLRRENRLWAAEFIEGLWRHYGVEGDQHGIAIAVVGGLFDLVTVWLIDGDPDDPEQVGALVESATRFYTAVRRGLSG